MSRSWILALNNSVFAGEVGGRLRSPGGMLQLDGRVVDLVRVTLG